MYIVVWFGSLIGHIPHILAMANTPSMRPSCGSLCENWSSVLLVSGGRKYEDPNLHLCILIITLILDNSQSLAWNSTQISYTKHFLIEKINVVRTLCYIKCKPPYSPLLMVVVDVTPQVTIFISWSEQLAPNQFWWASVSTPCFISCRWIFSA